MTKFIFNQTKISNISVCNNLVVFHISPNAFKFYLDKKTFRLVHATNTNEFVHSFSYSLSSKKFLNTSANVLFESDCGEHMTVSSNRLLSDPSVFSAFSDACLNVAKESIPLSCLLSLQNELDGSEEILETKEDLLIENSFQTFSSILKAGEDLEKQKEDEANPLSSIDIDILIQEAVDFNVKNSFEILINHALDTQNRDLFLLLTSTK